MNKVPETLEYKGRPVVRYISHLGYDAFIVESQPNKSELPHYYYYIRNPQLEVVEDNTHGDGELDIEFTENKVRFIIENNLKEITR